MKTNKKMITTIKDKEEQDTLAAYRALFSSCESLLGMFDTYTRMKELEITIGVANNASDGLKKLVAYNYEELVDFLQGLN